MDISSNDAPTSVWMWRIIVIVTVVAANIFASVGTVAYMSGNYSQKIENNALKNQELDRRVSDIPTRHEWNTLKEDVADIKRDVKEIAKDRK